MKKALLFIAKYFSYLCGIGFILILLLEVCYRYQVVDFYKSEWNGLNQLPIDTTKPTTLIFGDSFTAHPESYVTSLRAAYPNQSFVNTAIPGTGIIQHQLISNKRINQIKPQHIVYQFYVGNDFTDLKHPINYESNSLVRNVYWSIADRLIFLQYLNSRLAIFNWYNPEVIEIRGEKFSPAKYNSRVKTYFSASPSHLENTILLKGEQKEIYLQWKIHFEKFLKNIPKEVRITFLMIPQCAQISVDYQRKMESIGAVFNHSMQSIKTPLVQQIKKDFPAVEIINPLDYLQQLNANGINLYYENDPHFTVHTQQLLGEYLIKNGYFE